MKYAYSKVQYSFFSHLLQFFFFLCFLGTTPVQAQARGRAV